MDGDLNLIFGKIKFLLSTILDSGIHLKILLASGILAPTSAHITVVLTLRASELLGTQLLQGIAFV